MSDRIQTDLPREFLVAFDKLPEDHKKTFIMGLGLYTKMRGTRVWQESNALFDIETPLSHDELERLITILITSSFPSWLQP